jgi:hypothetical protein
VTLTAAIIGVVNTVLAAVVTFGVNLSDSQSTAITAAVNAVLVLVAVMLNPASRFSIRKPPAP